MVESLELINSVFEGHKRHARCFLHTTSLAAKTVTKQFDVPAKDTATAADAADKALLELAEGLDMSDVLPELLGDPQRNAVTGIEVEELDDMDGWEDARENMSAEQQAEHEDAMRPMKLVLVKVSALPRNLKRNYSQMRITASKNRLFYCQLSNEDQTEVGAMLQGR